MNRQHKDLLTFIREFIGQHEFSPTYREMANGVGLKSLSAIKKKLIVLQTEGHLKLFGKERGVVLFDADHAKVLNDVEGFVVSHIAGNLTADEAIAEIRKRLERASRL
jgi:SOS-response transcriptional repressor LexA